MTRTEREGFWRQHVDAAHAHPKSLAAYCRETELCYQSLLNWRRRFAAPRFIELEPPVTAGQPGLLIELGGLRVELPSTCPPAWAGRFVAALDEALQGAGGPTP